MTASERSTRVAGLIRSGGGRMTAARRAVVDQLLSAGGHVTADDLIDRVQRVLPGVDRSTIYRNLATLEDVGVVYHVHLAHGPSVYHLADGERHAHVVCEGCGAIAEVHADALHGLAAELLDTEGFTLSDQHFALTGRCRRCARGARSET